VDTDLQIIAERDKKLIIRVRQRYVTQSTDRAEILRVNGLNEHESIVVFEDADAPARINITDAIFIKYYDGQKHYERLEFKLGHGPLSLDMKKYLDKLRIQQSAARRENKK
jgi:hypothetical protein